MVQSRDTFSLDGLKSRVCDGPVHDIGGIFHQQPTRVGGVPIDLSGIDFRLVRCDTCGFAFKAPPIPEDRLLECYRRVAESHWGEQPDPRVRRFDLIRQTAERLSPGRRVLDIGCANGALLHYFGPSWDRHGIEPSASAAALAERRGIRVPAPTLENLAADELFDVILAIDVVEHIPDPVPFFARVARHLRPGGAFLLYTGDTGALTWRLEGSRYWYCSLSEHVSFYDRGSLTEIGARCGLSLADHRRMSHARTTPSDKTLCMLKNIAFLIGFYGRGFGVPPLRRLFLRHHAPSWMPAPDHMLVSMRPEPARTDTPALTVEIPRRRPAPARA